jgi:integrase
MGYGPINRLSDREVRTKGVGLHADGGGLYLQVTTAKVKTPNEPPRLLRSWIFRFWDGQRYRKMGLGSLATVSLAQARERAAEARRLREGGSDPIKTKRIQRAALAVAGAKAMTFDQCRDAYIAAHRPTWRNPKHVTQWENTLRTYATPVFGSLPVQAVDIGLVTKVIEPLWTTKPETASRLRGRIEAILDWATVRGHRQGENPARWRGHLDKVLPKVAKARKAKRERTGRDEHHAALPYAELATFMAQLRERDATAARALELLILTATRTSEIVGATWDEINLDAKTWTIPENRIKGEREHRVPLSDAAIAIVKQMRERRENDYLFPGSDRNRLSDMALLMLLRRMQRHDLTTHGFRATFKTWATEQTGFQREIIEKALAHRVGGKLEDAYQRGELLDKRRRLMNAWARFCSKPVSANVVTLPTAG